MKKFVASVELDGKVIRTHTLKIHGESSDAENAARALEILAKKIRQEKPELPDDPENPRSGAV